MQQARINRSILILLAGLLLASPVVFSLEVEPGVGIGVLYTDNARLSGSNETNDLVGVGYVGLRVDENSGSHNLSAEAEWVRMNYTRDTFSNQDYPRLRLTAGWEQIRDRLDWQAQNFFTQTRIDSLDGATPNNIQNANVFTFGPNIVFPVSGRHTVTVNPEYRNFYNENGNNNQQYALSAGWLYSMYRTTQVGLDGSVTKATYSGGAADYTRYSAHVAISGTGARSAYTLNLGGTNVDRDASSGSSRGVTGNVTLLYDLSGHSSLRGFAGSDISSTSTLLLNSEVAPDDGDFSNVQTSDAVVRNNIFRLTYRREDTTLNTELWSEFRDLDYEGDQNDREVRDFGANLDYSVTAALTTGVSGRYTRTKETNIGRRDKHYSITGTVGYDLTSKLTTNFDLRYQNRDTNDDSSNDYSAFSAFVRIVYGFAKVGRPRGG